MGTAKNLHYRKPKLVATGKKWYVEVYVRIPDNFRVPGSKRKWHRFKIYKDINLIRTLEYAENLRGWVEKALDQGWSPFNEQLDPQDPTLTEGKQWSCQQAALYFLQKWQGKEMSPAAIAKYERAVNRFVDWMRVRKFEHLHVDFISSDILETYLEQQRKALGWKSNATYNAERGFLTTMTNFLVSKKILSHKVVIGEKLKTKSRKHRFYDDVLFAKLVQTLEEKDPYLLFACRCVYYLCIRSEKELQQLKVGNIIPERKQILLNKGKTGERYIPVAKEMLEIFKGRGVLKAPREYYVFSVGSKTKFIPDGQPGPEPFGKGFFSKRFAKLRKEIGISGDHTIYSLKHTRVIHLKSAGASDADIMALTGHTTYDAYSDYLRDLGMTANPEALDKLSRKM